MDGRKRSRVTRVQKLQKIECLASANLAENDAVRAVAESCFQKVADRHCRHAVLRLPGLEPDEIRLGHLNFGGVFNEKDSLVLGDEFPEDIQERGLAGPGPAADQDVLAGEDIILEAVGERSVERPGLNEILHLKVAGIELADRQRDAAQGCTAG